MAKHRPLHARQLGSDPWWRDVRKLGVERAAIEAILEGASPDGDRARIDPHALVAPPGSQAAQAVLHFALLPFVPQYATLTYVAHTWDLGGRALQEWIAQQYATILAYGTDAEREAARYSLWVDFFEAPERATFLFPRLWAIVQTDAARAALLEDSGPVPWPVKRDLYAAALAVPALHDGVARGLVRSIYDVFGSIDVVEARALWRRLGAVDAALREAFERGLTPTQWRLDAILTVDESDERWQRWLPKASLAQSFLVELGELTPHAAWIPGAELRSGDTVLGTLLHRSFPFDRAIAHEEERSANEGPTILFRIKGSVEAARRALGTEVTAYPPGPASPHR